MQKGKQKKNKDKKIVEEARNKIDCPSKLGAKGPFEFDSPGLSLIAGKDSNILHVCAFSVIISIIFFPFIILVYESITILNNLVRRQLK